MAVSSVTSHGTGHILQQPQPQLHVMWDADSVPYTSSVLSAFLAELGDAQVRLLPYHRATCVVAPPPGLLLFCGTPS